jgi:hypothetical protein
MGELGCFRLGTLIRIPAEEVGGSNAAIYRPAIARRICHRLARRRGKAAALSARATDRSTAEAEARDWWSRETDTARTVGGIVADYIAAREQAEIASTARQKDAWKAMKSFWENVDPSGSTTPCAASMRRAARSARNAAL